MNSDDQNVKNNQNSDDDFAITSVSSDDGGNLTSSGAFADEDSNEDQKESQNQDNDERLFNDDFKRQDLINYVKKDEKDADDTQFIEEETAASAFDDDQAREQNEDSQTLEQPTDENSGESIDTKSEEPEKNEEEKEEIIEGKASQTKGSAEEDIFALLGAQDIPDEEKGELLAKMLDLIQSQVIIRVADEMTEDERAEFEKLVDAGDDEATQKYLEEKVPHFDQYFVEEAQKLRQKLAIEMSE